MEQKIDGIVARLSEPEITVPEMEALPPTPAATDATSRSTQTQSSRHSQNFFQELAHLHKFATVEGEGPHQSLGSNNNSQEPALDHELFKSMLNTGEAQRLLEEYHNMMSSFPFVPISPTITAIELSTKKPMLLLAIMTISSWKNKPKQLELESLYRQELANMTIIHPRKSLPLLQSMLVFLGW